MTCRVLKITSLGCTQPAYHHCKIPQVQDWGSYTWLDDGDDDEHDGKVNLCCDPVPKTSGVKRSAQLTDVFTCRSDQPPQNEWDVDVLKMT
jgi:hypothetical protein